jgi:hypothetical protein
MDKICYKCKERKLLEYFSKNKSQNDGFQSICKQCKKEEDARLYKSNPSQTKERNKRYTFKTKQWWDEYRQNLKCSICSESRYWVLDFHHLDEKTKKHNIGDIVNKGYSPLTILKEIKKCIVVCANCHRDIHYQEKTGAYQLNKRNK